MAGKADNSLFTKEKPMHVHEGGMGCGRVRQSPSWEKCEIRPEISLRTPTTDFIKSLTNGDLTFIQEAL